MKKKDMKYKDEIQDISWTIQKEKISPKEKISRVKTLISEIQNNPKEMDKLNKWLNKLEEKKRDTDFQVISYKDKEFRIYKWENKPFNKFIFPKGFELATFQEVVDLFARKLIQIPTEKFWKVYFCKYFSKTKQKGHIMRFCWVGSSDVYSSDWDLGYSDDGGWVVCVRRRKK